MTRFVPSPETAQNKLSSGDQQTEAQKLTSEAALAVQVVTLNVADARAFAVFSAFLAVEDVVAPVPPLDTAIGIENVVVCVKTFAAFFSGTLLDNLASLNVPVIRLLASSLDPSPSEDSTPALSFL